MALSSNRGVQLDLDIKGHVAVVTGAARGLGADIFRASAQEGAHVVVWDRAAAASERAAKLREEGGDTYAVVADDIDSGAVCKAVDGIVARRGSIEILVTCAGCSRDGAIADMTDAQ